MGSGEKNLSWAKVAQDSPWQSVWTSHKITKEVERLQHYFTKVLEFPKEVMEASRKEWKDVAVIIRCLG